MAKKTQTTERKPQPKRPADQGARAARHEDGGRGNGRAADARSASERLDKARPHGDAALHRELLHSMLLQRRFEERTAEAYALGKIGGFCHLYIGQEAVSTGSITMLRDDDYVITTYRDHGQALVRGITPRASACPWSR